MIRIKRDMGFMDRLRAYNILLDGDVIGEVRRGEKIELDVPKGRHQLQMKIDWTRSNIVDFDATEDTVEFECGSNIRGLKIFLSLLYVTILRNRYLRLERV